MREIIGFAGGDSVFAPGGSICNMYALLVARHKVTHRIQILRLIPYCQSRYWNWNLASKMGPTGCVNSP